MKDIHPNDYFLKAVGYTSSGERKEYDCSNKTLYCYNQHLISLEIPEGVKILDCDNNEITELILPKSILSLTCYNNLISELIIPNKIREITCDRNVKGLEKIYWKCDITLF